MSCVPMMLIDIGSVGLAAAAAFFLAFAVVAYIVFRLLRRTVRMALRMAIVAALLVIALIGSISLIYFGSGGKSKPQRPTANRAR